MSKGGAREGAGRPKGSKNRADENIRAQFEFFLNHACQDIVDLFDQLKQDNPKQALDAIRDYAEFVLPKLQRTDSNVNHSGEVDMNAKVTFVDTLPDTDKV